MNTCTAPDCLVRKGRLELPRVAPLEPKSSASTNSATFACWKPRGSHHWKARIIQIGKQLFYGDITSQSLSNLCFKDPSFRPLTRVFLTKVVPVGRSRVIFLDTGAITPVHALVIYLEKHAPYSPLPGALAHIAFALAELTNRLFVPSHHCGYAESGGSERREHASALSPNGRRRASNIGSRTLLQKLKNIVKSKGLDSDITSYLKNIPAGDLRARIVPLTGRRNHRLQAPTPSNSYGKP